MLDKCHIQDINEHNKNKKDLINRLNKIEGQIRGIKKMVEEAMSASIASLGKQYGEGNREASFLTNYLQELLKAQMIREKKR